MNILEGTPSLFMTPFTKSYDKSYLSENIPPILLLLDLLPLLFT